MKILAVTYQEEIEGLDERDLAGAPSSVPQVAYIETDSDRIELAKDLLRDCEPDENATLADDPIRLALEILERVET